MKYKNHLRKLALLSSLALSFIAYGDGTLPLPTVPETKPLEMAATTSSLNAIVDDQASLPSTDSLRACEVTPADSGLQFYKASGSVTKDGIDYVIQGICKNASSSHRVIYATNLADPKKSTVKVWLDGKLDNTTNFRSFNGKMKLTPASTGTDAFSLNRLNF
jgi:hypothetical protein